MAGPVDTGLWLNRRLVVGVDLGWGGAPESGLVTVGLVKGLDVVEKTMVRISERVNDEIGPQMCSISRLIVAQTASIATLSKQSPTLPYEAMSPQPSSRFVNCGHDQGVDDDVSGWRSLRAGHRCVVTGPKCLEAPSSVLLATCFGCLLRVL